MPGLQDSVSSVASTSSSPPPTKPTSPPPSNTSPTLFVSYGERSVKARVDKEVPLDEILRQLVASTQLGISEPAALFALRTEAGELVTEANLVKMLERAQSLVLTSSPTLEAAEIVEKLQSSEPAVLKLATFSLRSLIKEEGFLVEFEQRGGITALQEVVRRSTGNTLAYALLSLQNSISEERGWEGLEPDFAGRIVEIIAKEPLINITRPATAILRRLSMFPLSPALVDLVANSLPGSTADSGFAYIYREIGKQPEFLKIVVGRLSSGDVPVATLSLALINSLFRGATEMGDLRFGDQLEQLEISKIVGKLLENQRSSGGDLAPLLTFQGNLIAFYHLSLKSPVEEPSYTLFDDAWIGAGLDAVDDTFRWRRLGFLTESPQFEYERTGILGLKALSCFAKNHSSEFATAVKEQLLRPEERRCPIATVSSTVLLLIADHFDITQGMNQSPTAPQPLLLRLYECHALATLFFIRIWQESGAKSEDFDRIATLTRSQIAFVCNSSGVGEKPWFRIRQEFLQMEYRTVRDRQMREMEMEDDILNKAPVRSLRGRLYRESYEFVRGQRISCLHEGAWFRTPVSPQVSGLKKNSSVTGGTNAWRFYRLAPNRKVLHYVETKERIPIRGGLDELPERIDLSLVNDVVGSSTGTVGSGRGHSRSYSTTSIGTPTSPTSSATHLRSSVVSTTPLAFSLVSADGVLAELIAPDQQTYAEWVDGLSLLSPDGSITTQETAEYVQILTEIGVKIKLLDLSGEKVEIPSQLPVGPVPASQDFFYADYSI